MIAWSIALACGPGDTDPTDSIDPTGGTGTTDTSPPTTTGTWPTNPDVTVTPVSCAGPVARGPDAWVRSELGLDWTFEPDWRSANWDLRFGARGLVVSDFDGDGHLDMIVPQYSEKSRLLVGDGVGGFVDGPALPDLAALRGPIGGAAADIDGDGDSDAFLYGQLSPPVFLVNDGAGQFVGTEHPEWDQPDFLGCGGSASFGDMDLDGDLDLFYGRLGAYRTVDGVTSFVACPSRMLVNDGLGTFVDHPEMLDDDTDLSRILASGWHQVDEDPWPELYLVAENTADGEDVGDVEVLLPNFIYDNDASGLVHDAEGFPGLEVRLAGMGLAAGDINSDGLADFAVAGWGEVPTLDSTAGGVWVNQSVSRGVIPDAAVDQVVAWGGDYADLDNDGYEDLLVAFGATVQLPTRQPDGLWRGAPSGDWPSVAPDWGMDDDLSMRGFVVADVNRDGWLDVLKREMGGVVVTYVSKCGAESWLAVSLNDGQRPDGFAVGATVRVRAGDRVWTEWVVAGSTNFGSGGPAEVHFGLGDVEAIDGVDVVWPDGELTSYAGLPVRSFVEIQRP